MAYCFSQVRAVTLGISLLGVWVTGCATLTTPLSTPPASSASPTGASPLVESPVVSATLTPTPRATALPSSSVPEVNPGQAEKLLNQISHDLSKKVAIAKQDTGKTYLSSLLLAQQSEQLVKGTFSSDLQRLASDVPIDTEEYRLEIRQADAAQAVLVAIAKQPGFASYSGAVFAVPGSLPVVGMCKTNVPSQVPPAAPARLLSVVQCPNGSSAVN